MSDRPKAKVPEPQHNVLGKLAGRAQRKMFNIPPPPPPRPIGKKLNIAKLNIELGNVELLANRSERWGWGTVGHNMQTTNSHSNHNLLTKLAGRAQRKMSNCSPPPPPRPIGKKLNIAKLNIELGNDGGFLDMDVGLFGY